MELRLGRRCRRQEILDLESFEERTGPAMHEQQGYGIWVLVPAMDEVDIQNVEVIYLDGRSQVGLLVDLFVEFAPVECFPRFRKTLNLKEWRSLILSRAVDLVGQISELELLLESVNLFLRYVKLPRSCRYRRFMNSVAAKSAFDVGDCDF